MIRRFPEGMILLAWVAGACAAQDPEAGAPKPYNGSVYVSFVAGSCQHEVASVGVGGGAEGFLWKGLTLGAEGGYYQFVESGGLQWGTGSLDLGYHFTNRKRPGRIDPFVRTALVGAGVTRGGMLAAGSIGGGLNYWFKPRVALRTEGRVHLLSSEALVMFHIGLSFR